MARWSSSKSWANRFEVLLTALDHVELADHAIDQCLASTGQVEEHRRDAGPQGGLLGRDPDGFPVYDVEGERDLTDLVLVVQPDRVPYLADDLLHAAVTDAADVLQPGDRVRQVVVGHREGALTQPAQRGVQRPGQDDGERDGDDQRDQHHYRLDHGLLDHVRLGPVGLGEQLDLKLDFRPAHQVDDRPDRLRRALGEGGAGRLADRAGDIGGGPFGQRHGVTAVGLVHQFVLARRGGQFEGGQGLLLAGLGGHERRVLLLVEPGRTQRGEAHRLLLRGTRLGSGEGGDGPEAVPDPALTGELTEGFAVVAEVGEDHAVAQYRLDNQHLLAVEHLLAGAVQGRQVVIDLADPGLDRLRHGADAVALPVVRGDLLVRTPDGQVVRVRVGPRVGQVGGAAIRSLCRSWVRADTSADSAVSDRIMFASSAVWPTSTSRTVASARTAATGTTRMSASLDRILVSRSRGSQRRRAPCSGGPFSGRVVGPVLTTSPPSFLPRVATPPVPAATDGAARGTAAISSEAAGFGKRRYGRNRSDGTEPLLCSPKPFYSRAPELGKYRQSGRLHLES